MSKSRLEAFSDGVFAVAITLLVLDLHVPVLTIHGLARELLRMWPQYAAFVISFVTVGIIWINHHAMIGRLRQPDHAILFLNMTLLMWIVLLPFTTSLMASYLNRSRGENLAAGLYAASLLLMSITFSGLNRHILFTKPHLLSVQMSEERRRQILSRGVTGLLPYAVATALAPVSQYATLAICGAVAAFYALPIASGGGSQE